MCENLTLGLLEDFPLALRLSSPAAGIKERDQRAASVQEVGVPVVQQMSFSGAGHRAQHTHLE